MTLINGALYGFSNVVIYANGEELQGITSINYGDSQEMADEIQIGTNRFFGRGFGPVSFSGSIEMMVETMFALQRSAPNGRVQELVLTISVEYQNTTGQVIFDKLEGVQIKENKRDLGAGNTSMKVATELQIGNIVWQS